MLAYNRGEFRMTPNVFISSTFYDLRYAREDIGRFVESYGFSSILFERGDIGYLPGQNLDVSCYDTMKLADMAIVIIGGRYGSPASGEDYDNFKKYLSVTHKEFDAAIKSNTPIYVFIDESVQSEYRVYKNNKKEIESGELKLSFVAVDNINVHRFVDEIFSFPDIPVWGFKDVSEIKEILKKQWAGMFQNYLLMRKKVVPYQDMESSVQNIYGLIQQLNLTIDKIGSKVFESDPTDLSDLERKKKVERIANMIANSFEFIAPNMSVEEKRQFLVFFVAKLKDLFDKGSLELVFSEEKDDRDIFYSSLSYKDVQIAEVNNHLQYEEDFSLLENDIIEEVVNRLLRADYLKLMKLVK